MKAESDANPFGDQIAEKPRSKAKPPVDERPRTERFIDASFLEMLKHRTRKINEGQNGVIFRLNMGSLSTADHEHFKKAGLDFEGDNVAKILKLNTGGQGKQEFAMQKQVHELLANQADPTMYAQIPEAKFYRSLPLTTDSKEYLALYGVKAGQECEVIVMDEVKGDDVATALYKEVLRRHPQAVHLASYADEMDFIDLQSHVAQVLAFAAPSGKSRDEQERQFEERKVFALNSEKVFRYLAQSGFKINPKIVEKMERTMDLLHDNGLIHRDAHHRNFMVTGSLGLPKAGEPEPEVYLIDFGTTVAFEGAFSDELYSVQTGADGIKNYLNDKAVPKDLRTHLLPESAGLAKERAFRQNLSALQARLLAKPSWVQILSQFEQDPGMSVNRTARLFQMSPEPKWDTFFVAVQVLIESSSLSPQIAQEFLQQQRRKATPADQAKIAQFLELLK